ncbi:MAG: M28 family peptidase [Planctomycetota bacterium]
MDPRSPRSAGVSASPGRDAWRRRALLGAFLALSACSDYEGAGFSGESARARCERLVAIGPRQPGSPGIRKAADLIVSDLRAIDPRLELKRQRFTQPEIAGSTEFENLWVEIPPTPARSDAPILILAAHYDSKITHPGEQDFAFVGALDAAASCAVLLELAKHLVGTAAQPFEVWLVFFDGEESLEWDWNDAKALIGSRHFARTLSADKARFPTGIASRVKAMVLLDLLGDQVFKIDREKESNPTLIDLFARAAATLGLSEQVFRFETQVSGDDHIPFKQLGVRVIDLIDFQWRVPAQHREGMPPEAKQYFPFWHTADDTMERVSAASLARIGDLILRALPLLAAEVVK